MRNTEELGGGMPIDHPEARLARLRATIARIKEATQRELDSHRSQYERLLTALRSEGIPLASLAVSEAPEPQWTKLIGYVFDPAKPHGLGSKVLATAIGPEILGSGHDSKDLKWAEARVQAEFPLGGFKGEGCCVDLMIQVDGYVVLVEQKTDSIERPGQLKRYSGALRHNHPHLASQKVVKVFLTPDGRAPKEDLEWMPLSHQQLVDRLSEPLDDTTLSVVARHNLCGFLLDLVSGPLALDQPTLKDLSKRISEMLNDSRKYPDFRWWCDHDVPNIHHLMKIVEVCHA